MSNIDTFLESLNYDKPKVNVLGRNTIIDLIPKSKRCGIYVLHFKDNEYYAGLSARLCTCISRKDEAE